MLPRRPRGVLFREACIVIEGPRLAMQIIEIKLRLHMLPGKIIAYPFHLQYGFKMIHSWKIDGMELNHYAFFVLPFYLKISANRYFT